MGEVRAQRVLGPRGMLAPQRSSVAPRTARRTQHRGAALLVVASLVLVLLTACGSSVRIRQPTAGARLPQPVVAQIGRASGSPSPAPTSSSPT